MHKLEVKRTNQMEEKGRSIPGRHREENLYPGSLTMGIQFGPPHSLKTTGVYKHFLLGFCISRTLSLYLTPLDRPAHVGLIACSKRSQGLGYGSMSKIS